MHNIEIRAFFELLKSGLWEKDVKDISIFPLSQKVWEYIVNIAKEQTVLGLIYRGIKHLPKEFHPQKSILLEIVVEMDRLEKSNIKVNEILGELIGGYKKVGIIPILQKGQGVAMYYNYPSLRVSGDIDFYLKSEEEYLKIKNILKEGKVKVLSMPDNSFVYEYKDVEVENHRLLIDISNPFKKKYIKFLIDKYGFEKVNIDNVEVMVPAPLLNLVMLNTHIMKHTFGWGIGLRQICDIARAYYVLYGKIEECEIKKVYKDLEINRWSRLLHSFLVEYIGIESKYLPYKEEAEDSNNLLRIILKSGNFGFNIRKKRGKNIVFQRKFNTFASFFKRGIFSMKYAPKESFWLVVGLMKGQL